MKFPRQHTPVWVLVETNRLEESDYLLRPNGHDIEVYGHTALARRVETTGTNTVNTIPKTGTVCE